MNSSSSQKFNTARLERVSHKAKVAIQQLQDLSEDLLSLFDNLDVVDSTAELSTKELAAYRKAIMDFLVVRELLLNTLKHIKRTDISPIQAEQFSLLENTEGQGI